MDKTIRITPQDLNEAATFLKQRLASITEEVRSIQGRITDITANWQGASQQAFVGQWENDMYPILRDTLPQVVEGVAAELDAAATFFREGDDRMASAFKSK